MQSMGPRNAGWASQASFPLNPFPKGIQSLARVRTKVNLCTAPVHCAFNGSATVPMVNDVAEADTDRNVSFAPISPMVIRAPHVDFTGFPKNLLNLFLSHSGVKSSKVRSCYSVGRRPESYRQQYRCRSDAKQ